MLNYLETAENIKIYRFKDSYWSEIPFKKRDRNERSGVQSTKSKAFDVVNRKTGGQESASIAGLQ